MLSDDTGKANLFLCF